MFLRQRLRERLKKARETAGMTQIEVARYFDWSPSKVIRIENGKIAVSVADTRGLVARYGLDTEESQELVELAKAARRPSWYAAYKEIMTPALETFVAYEEVARVVRNYERNVIPGLLQTEEYARALLKGLQNDGDLRALELRVDLRMQRQRVLVDDEAEFFFIIDEAVLRRMIGGEAIMRQQFEALLSVNEKPNVTILYVPFSVGVYPSFRRPYQLFEIEPGGGDLIVYLESPAGETLISERAASPKAVEPADYLDAFSNIEESDDSKPINEEVLFGPISAGSANS
ncbi:helix-turn-helix transcriptional regulator (plasmid) [Streptomyces sp. NBC_00490]|uniref:helix-turn-helix domain-containing protein n=1 Tax=Streptomyces sp. NBC_00490 TaxID=2903657 RepID=UPI002E198EA2